MGTSRLLSRTLVAVTAYGMALAAQAAITGEVIAAYEGYSSNTGVMSAQNGSGFHLQACGGDLSHNGVPRYFVHMVVGSGTLPDGYPNAAVAASDEDCVQTVVLFDAPNMRVSTRPKWSRDGTRVATYATFWDLGSGVVTASGLYVGDVVRDGTGRPIGLANFALLIASPNEMNFSWSGDDQRIAYVAGAPDGKGGMQQDIFLFDILTRTSRNVTNTQATNEDQPDYSPVGDRIAFTSLVAIKGTYRYDIFSISAFGGAVAQVTTKATTGEPQNKFPTYSPDGLNIAFSAGSATTAPLHDFDIYRIKADGSGKAVNLTSRQSGSYRVATWRR